MLQTVLKALFCFCLLLRVSLEALLQVGNQVLRKIVDSRVGAEKNKSRA